MSVVNSSQEDRQGEGTRGDSYLPLEISPIGVAADITPAAAAHLRLIPGQPVWVAVKATETRAYPRLVNSTSKEAVMRLSIRNQFDGEVVDIARGEVMGIVRTRLAGGTEITAAITLEAIDELGLAVGGPAVVLIKSTEISVGVR